MTPTEYREMLDGLFAQARTAADGNGELLFDATEQLLLYAASIAVAHDMPIAYFMEMSHGKFTEAQVAAEGENCVRH